jgi:asparagine synthase (glutamine-hydrolysing)
MCGFAGYASRNGGLSLDIIREMLRLQKHRGPNDQGIVGVVDEGRRIEDVTRSDSHDLKDAQWLFGFNRLSILDLSYNGHQPMVSRERDVLLMLNGEVYNAFNFKHELEERGARFRSTTDTEVILELYLSFGLQDTLKRLNGMFAIAIFDLRLQKLFLARDRFGVKPLYVAKTHNSLAFASEIKSFKAIKEINFQLAAESIDEFLLFRNLINETLFQNIENIAPGMVWEIDETTSIKKSRFFDIQSYTTRPHANDAIDEIERSLRQSVKSQLAADVVVGSQLSGGIDSSLVTLFAMQQGKKDHLITVSIVPDDPIYSEEHWIDAAAETSGVTAFKFPLDAKYYLSVFDRVIWHFEHPLNHPNTVGIFLLAEKAKSHLTVLLSGEGADEVLGGYDRFLNTISTIESFKSSLRIMRDYPQRDPFSYINLAFGARRQILGSAFSSLRDLLHIRPEFNIARAMQKRQDIWSQFSGDPFLRQRKFEIATYLPDLLMRQDKMCMAHSIENRVPFLDNEFVEFAMTLPANHVLCHNGIAQTKHILKRIAARHFSPKFAFRDKVGFSVPIRRYIDTKEFRERWFSEWSPRLSLRGIFQTDSIDRWAKEPYLATNNQLGLLWQIAGFESWAHQFLDKAGPS